MNESQTRRQRNDARGFPGDGTAGRADEVTGNAVIGFERSLVGAVRSLEVVLAFVVRADRGL